MSRPVRSIARQMPGISTATFLVDLLVSLACLAYAGWELRGLFLGEAFSFTPLIGIALGFGITGLFGNLMLLSMKRAGLFFAWLHILIALGVTFYGMYLFSEGLKELTPATRGPFIVKSAIALVLCYTLIVVYQHAMKRAGDFLRR